MSSHGMVGKTHEIAELSSRAVSQGGPLPREAP